MELLVLIVCSLVLYGSMYLVFNCRCQHYEIDAMRCSCRYCGMGLREIQLLGGNCNHSRFMYFNTPPDYSIVNPWVWRKGVHTPESKLYSYVEYQYVDPKAPPEVIQMFQEMMYRRGSWIKYHPEHGYTYVKD